MKFSQFLQEQKDALEISEDIKQWLSDNGIKLSDCTMTSDGLNVNQSVRILRVDGGKLPVKFNIINGDFRVSMCDLVTLEGSPNHCVTFNCENNQRLASLEGGPLNVTGHYYFSGTDIENLIGVPDTIGGDFYGTGCKRLSSLKGGPANITGAFIIMECPKLKSLEHGPRTVGKTYNVAENDLRSLKGAPRAVNGSFGIGKNKNLSSLEYGPETVSANYVVDDLPALTSLHNIHKIIKSCGEFHCNGYKTHMLGIFKITNKLHHSTEEYSEYPSLDLDIMYGILKKHIHDGVNGMFEAQADLLDTGFDEVAKL